MDFNQIRSAPIEPLLQSRGFRSQYNRWACHAHDDRRPSCTIRGNRLKCWVCAKSWANLDLVVELDGIDLRSAALHLAAFYGLPLEDRPLTPAERIVYAQRARRAEAIAQRLADFADGLRLVVDRRLKIEAAVLECIFQSLEDTASLEIPEIAERLSTLDRWHRWAWLLQRAKPRDIAATWQQMHADPAAADAVERLGREDREHSETITHAIVELLATTQVAGVAV